MFWSPDDAGARRVVRPLGAADRDAVLALDARVTGEHRTLAVDAGLDGGVATPDLAPSRCGRRGRRSRSSRRDPAAGAALLARGARARACGSPCPRPTRPRWRRCSPSGCTERPGVVRMRRGAPVAWRPDELWGVFSLFFG